MASVRSVIFGSCVHCRGVSRSFNGLLMPKLNEKFGTVKIQRRREHASPMRLLIFLLALAIRSCECFSIVSVGARAARHSTAIMGARKGGDVTRREVLDGSSLTKQFYDPDGWRKGLPPGWSPALVASLGAVAASYGSSSRGKLFAEMQALSDGSAKNDGKVSHMPLVTISAARSLGSVNVELNVPASETVDLMWLTDASTGEIFAGRRFSAKERPSLVLLVDRGRRFVPTVHSTADGVWVGEVVVAAG